MFIWNSDKTELINSDKVSNFYIGFTPANRNKIFARQAPIKPDTTNNCDYYEDDLVKKCKDYNEAKKYLERIGVLLQAADLS